MTCDRAFVWTEVYHIHLWIVRIVWDLWRGVRCLYERGTRWHTWHGCYFCHYGIWHAFQKAEQLCLILKTQQHRAPNFRSRWNWMYLKAHSEKTIFGLHVSHRYKVQVRSLFPSYRGGKVRNGAEHSSPAREPVHWASENKEANEGFQWLSLKGSIG